MKLALFSTKPYDKKFFCEYYEKLYGNKEGIQCFENKLDLETVHLAKGYEAVCIFVNDEAGKEVLNKLQQGGTKLLLLRASGFDNVDVEEAKRLGIKVMRVPEYSPSAVAEHAVALLLSLNRKTHKAYARTKEFNFSIDGLMGFDIRGKTVGIIGTGKIGAFFAEIMHGFGCQLVAYDIVHNDQLINKFDLKYIELDELLSRSDIISLHAPLNKHTFHMINSENLPKVKKGAVLINTSRGGLIDTKALIKSLKSEKLGGAAIDVYEREHDIFFNDMSVDIIHDDQLTRLLSFPNVLVTGHQAFFTEEAFRSIVETTFNNFEDFQNHKQTKNDLTAEQG